MADGASATRLRAALFSNAAVGEQYLQSGQFPQDVSCAAWDARAVANLGNALVTRACELHGCDVHELCKELSWHAQLVKHGESWHLRHTAGGDCTFCRKEFPELMAQLAPARRGRPTKKKRGRPTVNGAAVLMYCYSSLVLALVVGLPVDEGECTGYVRVVSLFVSATQ